MAMGRSVNRLEYNFSTGETDGGMLESYYVPYTQDTGLSTGNSISITVPPHSTDFIDGSGCYMKLLFDVKNADGTNLALPADKKPPVILCSGAFGNFFSSIGVSVNGCRLPAVTEAPYTAFLVDVLGSGSTYLNSFLSDASAVRGFMYQGRKIEGNEYFNDSANAYRLLNGGKMELYGRLASDFLTTCGQLIPNNVRLDITLTRQASSFILGAKDANKEYKINLREVSFFVKKVKLNAPAMAGVDQSLMTRGLLKYQRLSTQVAAVGKSTIFRWANMFANGLLPNRIFFALVHEAGYKGALNYQPMYFDLAGVEQATVHVDGREVLPEPLKPHIVYSGKDKKKELDTTKSLVVNPVMALAGALDILNNRNTGIGISQKQWLTGLAIYGVNLPYRGSMTPRQGTLDILIEFSHPPKDNFMCVAMAEFDQLLHVGGPERTFTVLV